MLFHLELRGVDDVARPAARRKEQYVNPLQIACPDETRGNRFGSGSGKGSDSGVGTGASATTDHGAQAKGNSPRSAGSGFGSTDDV